MSKWKNFLNKVWSWLKKYPTIITLCILVPSLAYIIRYASTNEYYYYNYYFDGEQLDVDEENFRLTGIKKIANVYQTSINFSYQGASCYQNYYAICADNFEAIIIYDTNKMNKGPVHIIETGTVNTDWHCNQMFFGPDFYSAHDKFPLLYISMESSKVHSTIAFRIYQLGGEYRVAQVQKLTLEFDDDKGPLYFMNSYYDYEDRTIYYGGYTKNTYMKEADNFIRFYTFELPDYRSSEEALRASESLATFELPSETATQGGFISDHHLYQTFSFNSKDNPLRAPKMRVVDLYERKIILDYQDLWKDFGVAEEFEHLAVNNEGKLFSVGNPFNIYEFEYTDKIGEL